MSDTKASAALFAKSVGGLQAEIDALRTIAAQLAEALAALAGNEINADHPWPRAALEAWEKYDSIR